MHKLGIMHRDLKPANILMNSKDRSDLGIKLTDFGFSTFFDLQKGCKEMCGSPLYMSPEILKRDRQPYNQKVDVWALGVIAFKLFFGNDVHPYKNIRTVDDLERTANRLCANKNKPG